MMEIIFAIKTNEHASYYTQKSEYLHFTVLEYRSDLTTRQTQVIVLLIRL